MTHWLLLICIGLVVAGVAAFWWQVGLIVAGVLCAVWLLFREVPDGADD